MTDKAGNPAVVRCIIHTPLSYLCLRELIAVRSYASRHLYVIATSHESAMQILGLCERDNWDEVQILSAGRQSTHFGKLAAFPKLLRTRWMLSRMLSKIQNSDDVVLSHLANPYSRLVIEARREAGVSCIAVDDGTTTINEFGVLTTCGCLDMANSPPRSSSFFARLEEAVFSTAPVFAQDASFFSFWRLSEMTKSSAPVVLERNRFEVFRSQMSGKDVSKAAFFVGQPFVRRGVLDMPTYRNILRCIAEHYRAAGLGFVYFPHRNETTASFEEIFPVRRLEHPLETYLAELDRLPTVIAGFYSNAVMTGNFLFGDQMSSEVFWGFDALAPELASSPLIEKVMMQEAQKSPNFSINRKLNLPPYSTGEQ